MLPDYVFAIDPGTTESGICLVRTSDYRPLAGGKIDNEDVADFILANHMSISSKCTVGTVIERMQGNNMPVSSDVFITCEWIGRFQERIPVVDPYVHSPKFVYRREEYKAICHNLYTHNDKGIRDALVERFAYGQPNFGKGTKKEPGWFYGFSKDQWQAYAIAVTYIDRSKESEK